jgi:hypothetical protein
MLQKRATPKLCVSYSMSRIIGLKGFCLHGALWYACNNALEMLLSNYVTRVVRFKNHSGEDGTDAEHEEPLEVSLN